MMNFDTKSILPVIIRYLLTMVGTWITANEYLNANQWSSINEWVMQGVGVALMIGPSLWAAWKRPSSDALKVAEKVDQLKPADGKVVVETKAGKPDIVVEAKK